MSQEQQQYTNVEEPTEQQQIESKQQPKKQHSYTYWVDEKNKSRTLPPEQRPQKIDPPKVITQKIEQGRSDWNTVGTWQNRKISLSDIEKQYNQKLNSWISQNCPEYKIQKLQLKGESQILFTRNKKVLTYELNGKVEFQKKLKQEKTEKLVENVQQKQSNLNVSESSQSDKAQTDRSPQKQIIKKSSSSTSKSFKSKASTMTFEIVDLTEHGDRDFKYKADEAQDKKFIAKESQNLLCLLEQVLKSFK